MIQKEWRLVAIIPQMWGDETPARVASQNDEKVLFRLCLVGPTRFNVENRVIYGEKPVNLGTMEEWAIFVQNVTKAQALPPLYKEDFANTIELDI